MKRLLLDGPPVVFLLLFVAIFGMYTVAGYKLERKR